MFFSCALCAFSLPGVIQTIPDESGTFVYYRDASFQRESYFGIIYYNDETYGVRYFAPAVTDVYPLEPKKEVEILFSVDPQKKYVELTGERFLNSITPDDTSIVNYLHDMMYELNARRRAAGIVEKRLSVPQEFEEFGGNVSIVFEPQIPLFNIKSISTSGGKPVFTLVTAGKLVSADDDSFSEFEGLPLKIDGKSRAEKIKPAKKCEFSFSKYPEFTQKIELDKNWHQSADNLYVLGSKGGVSDNAILAMDILDFSHIESRSEKRLILDTLKRNFLLGKEASYPYAELSKVRKVSSAEIYENIFYNDVSKTFTKDFKVIEELDENKTAVMTLTVFYGVYSQKSRYFDAIVESYSVE